MRMRIRYLGFVALALLATAGCSAGGSPSVVSGVVSGHPAVSSHPAVSGHPAPSVHGPVPAPIAVEGMDTPTLGVVLADLKGMTLYRFTKESGGKIACRGACPKTWTPLRVQPGTVPRLPPPIKGKLGHVTRPDGTLQLTFDGWPLYTFTGDRQPSDTMGNGKNGEWFAITGLSRLR